MDIATDYRDRAGALVALFDRTFTASEGAQEGRLIGGLVRALLDNVPARDLRVFIALAEGEPVGCILFSRLVFPRDPRVVFLLSPVAVAPDRQGAGIGQALIRHGVDALRADGAALVVTYGDPAFYGRLGFGPVAPETLAPPQPLSQPEGWIALPLDGAPLGPLQGPSRAVAPFDDPALW